MKIVSVIFLQNQQHVLSNISDRKKRNGGVKNGMLHGENAKIINMLLTISVTGKKKLPFGTSLKKSIRIQRRPNIRVGVYRTLYKFNQSIK